MVSRIPPDTALRPDSLAVSEEKVVVAKETAVVGRVRVRTQTEAVEAMVSETINSEHIEIERVTINREIDRIPETRREGDVLILPLVEEVLVVEKRLVLKEELHIRCRSVAETISAPVTVRKQRAVIERETSDGMQEIEE